MQRIPRWLAAIAIAIFILGEAFSIYIFILNRRLTRELVNHAWSEPTVILSAARRTPVRVATLYGVDWRITAPVRLQALPRHVPNAFLAAEDVRFHHHIGIDPIGMVRALFTNLRAHGIAAGGSTIDQQIIKTRFLSQERTWRRKITEIVLAMLLDARMPKNEILEVYLNDVYLGHNAGKPVLGIDEASRLYFNKRPSELRVDEAAVLAGMIRAPNRDTPEKRPDIARARRDAILAVMRDHDWISEAQLADAKSRDVEFTGGTIPQAPYPFYLRALRADIVKEVGVRTVIEGALTIVCEMDPDAQRNAERVASRAPSALEATHSWIRTQARSEPLQVALLSVDPRNGGIRALVGGSDYNVSPFDRTTAMHRQPGSAFKTFAYLPAIVSKKVTAATLLLDAPVSIAVNGNETWQPHNYDDRYRGRVTVREAFEHSLNVPTVRLSEDVGVAKVANTAEKFGFEEHFARIPALPLGVTEVSMRELTAAYTPFPNLGIRVEPFLLREVRDRNGKTLFAHDLEQKR
ncbi:MAG: penicillin-binding protein, partial [Thermoanaerobaculia bacterium]|nr:penicillin-binding protein [Thermoanaerobaculia bacterium]